MAGGHLCTKRKELSRYTIKKQTKKCINLLPLFALEKKKHYFYLIDFSIFILFIFTLLTNIFIFGEIKKNTS